MRPKAVISGSYHRAPDKLKRLFRELEVNGCRILSPITLDFIDRSDQVVRIRNEANLTVRELELFHLRALAESDFLLLHAPDGYVGTSASFELGYAAALRIPCFCFEELSDKMLASQVRLVGSVFEIIDVLALAAF